MIKRRGISAGRTARAKSLRVLSQLKLPGELPSFALRAGDDTADSLRHGNPGFLVVSQLGFRLCGNPRK